MMDFFTLVSFFFLDLSIFEASIFAPASSAVRPTSHQPFHQPRDLHPTSSSTLTLRRTQWGAQASIAHLVTQGTESQSQ